LAGRAAVIRARLPKPFDAEDRPPSPPGQHVNQDMTSFLIGHAVEPDGPRGLALMAAEAGSGPCPLRLALGNAFCPGGVSLAVGGAELTTAGSPGDAVVVGLGQRDIGALVRFVSQSECDGGRRIANVVVS